MQQIVLGLGLIGVLLTAAGEACAWGERGHAVIARTAVDALPDDGPAFLRRQRDYIGAMASVADSWRSESEPFLKIDEDPNHGWFREQFAFMRQPPRSRYAFVLALRAEQQRIAASDPERARRMNVRWTGTLPYAAIEGYGRLVAGMRQIRRARAAGQDSAALEQSCAFYAAWFSHYLADAAQPLHDSIHHDGWQGPNPHDYSRDPKVHGRMESHYVALIDLSESDLAPQLPALPGHQRGDVFEIILAQLERGTARVEQVYQLDQRGAFDDRNDTQARALVYLTAGEGAALLRDLLYRAWRESAVPPAAAPLPGSPEPSNPRYDPATGSAPAGLAPALE